MRDIFTPRIIIILVVIIVAWIGIGILIYYQTQPGAPITVYSTSTSTITTSTVTTTSPTVTATSPFSESEQEYIALITDHSTRLIDAIATISTLLGDIQVDNASWRAQATTQADILIAMHVEMEGVSTPYSMVNIHYNYIYATSAYKSAAQVIKYGIQEQSVESIQQGISLINSGTSLFNNSINMLNTFFASKQ